MMDIDDFYFHNCAGPCPCQNCKEYKDAKFGGKQEEKEKLIMNESQKLIKTNFNSTKMKAFQEVKKELFKAIKRFSEFNSPHEGYAIILEELDELWEEVRAKNKDRNNEGGQNKERMRKEACQVAAMALRFMIDCTN